MKYLCAHRWAFNAWGGALQAQEDALTPATGHEVTLRITHCGMCHSDIHIREGGFDMGGGKLSSLERSGVTLPVTMGHEIVGEVDEIGPDVKDVSLGMQVVAYPWLAAADVRVEINHDHRVVRGRLE